MKNLAFLFITILTTIFSFSVYGQTQYLTPDNSEFYLIETKVTQDFVLHAKTYHADLGVDRSNGQYDKEFKFVPAGHGWFKIKSRAYNHPDYFVTASPYNSHEPNRNNVALRKDNGEAGQKFRLRYKGSGWVEIVSALGDHLVLTFEPYSHQQRGNIKLGYANGSSQQRFRLVRTTVPNDHQMNHQLYIINTKLNPNLVLDVTSGRAAPGTNIQLWTNYGKPAQKFRLQKKGYGQFNIVSALYNSHGNPLVIAGENHQPQQGENVRLEQQVNYYRPGQVFNLKTTNEKGYFTINVAGTNVALDVPRGQAFNGANIQLWQNYGVDAQKFKFIEDLDRNN